MSKSIEDLRATLFATLDAVKSGTMDLDRARAINELGKTITDTAKVEVDYLKAMGGDGKSKFIPVDSDEQAALPSGIVGITRHRIAG